MAKWPWKQCAACGECSSETIRVIAARCRPPRPQQRQTTPAKRDAFVSGSTKLAYLACKTGLRDHHIFAHVQLSALSAGGAIDPVLARTGVDLLICNAAMSAVAAIDLIDASRSTP